MHQVLHPPPGLGHCPRQLAASQQQVIHHRSSCYRRCRAPFTSVPTGQSPRSRWIGPASAAAQDAASSEPEQTPVVEATSVQEPGRAPQAVSPGMSKACILPCYIPAFCKHSGKHPSRCCLLTDISEIVPQMPQSLVSQATAGYTALGAAYGAVVSLWKSTPVQTSPFASEQPNADPGGYWLACRGWG
jgi:hypothetical protein